MPKWYEAILELCSTFSIWTHDLLFQLNGYTELEMEITQTILMH